MTLPLTLHPFHKPFHHISPIFSSLFHYALFISYFFIFPFFFIHTILASPIPKQQSKEGTIRQITTLIPFNHYHYHYHYHYHHHYHAFNSIRYNIILLYCTIPYLTIHHHTILYYTLKIYNYIFTCNLYFIYLSIYPSIYLFIYLFL
ncbi:hypothetical protein F4703DRAFT_1060697 [Phycomyces blakesleeanus]